jgi:hypothetical protein
LEDIYEEEKSEDSTETLHDGKGKKTNPLQKYAKKKSTKRDNPLMSALKRGIRAITPVKSRGVAETVAVKVAGVIEKVAEEVVETDAVKQKRKEIQETLTQIYSQQGRPTIEGGENTKAKGGWANSGTIPKSGSGRIGKGGETRKENTSGTAKK